ncbi:MAG: hypothetical protein WC005_06440 [Candidatus Nanopelagicales bacterium]
MGAQRCHEEVTQVAEWLGTVTANNVDLARVELLLGIDPIQWWVLAVDIDFSDFGRRSVTALAVPAKTTRDELIQVYRQGRRVPVTAFEAITIEPEHPDQASGRMPDDLPVKTISDFMSYGFRHLEMRLHVGWANLPTDLLLEIVETVK